MPIPYAGQLAALGTASCWTASSLAFDTATRRVGALTVNTLRLAFATVLLIPVCTLLRGRPLPLDASPRAWLILSLSGLLGFTFGDFCLFRSYLLLGPRLSSVLMALAPPLAALIGWRVLGETLSGRALAGMGLTVAGISWAILERRRPPAPAASVDAAAPVSAPPSRHPILGVALGLGGAFGQAGGLVLSKLGMGTYNPFAATQVRVLAGAAGYVVVLSALRWWPRVRQAFGDRPALASIGIGAFFAPVVGVSLSLLAIQLTLVGIAASLMALTPIFIIPAVVLLRGERVGPGGIAGAALAVAGVALLFYPA